MNGKPLRIAGLVLVLAVVGVGMVAILSRRATAAKPRITMYKSLGCVCCDRWSRYMEPHGFEMRIVARTRLHEVKAQNGVPPGLYSCHTALVDGHVVEGHVPAETVRRMLEARPGPEGIGVAGMPSGSPGMGGPPEPFDVVAFERGRIVGIYASY